MNRYQRFLCAIAALAVSAVALPDEAAAHGGQFRGPPQPAPPPPIRVPVDPGKPATPPPPPSIGQPPGPITPGGKPAPSTPPPPPPTVTPGGAPGTGIPHWRTKRRAAQTATKDAWTVWWRLNGWNWMPTRHDGLRRRAGVITPSTSGEDEKLASWEQRREILARTVLVPSLCGYLDPAKKVDDEVRAAALIALARTTTEASHMGKILDFARDAKQALVVRESACLAAGLLRRTIGPRPLDAAGYDTLRNELLRLFQDTQLPTRARAMCALSVGVLADQPYATPFTKDGRLVTRVLWEALAHRWSNPELPVALLTALGMQPREGVPEKVRDGLEDIVFGKRVARMKWSADARSHALTARLRLGGSSRAALLSRLLPSRRVPISVRNAAWLGLAGFCEDFTSKERMTAFEAWKRAYERVSDPIQRGYAFLALGRLMETDLADNPDSLLLYQNLGPAFLLREARVSTGEARGFAALALGLAARGASGTSRAAVSFRRDAVALLRHNFSEDARSVNTRGAYAIALGLVGSTESAHKIAALVANRREQPVNRRYGAEALAMLGVNDAPVRDALKAAVLDRRASETRAGAAIALSALALDADGEVLLKALDAAPTERALGHIALAIGHLGNLDATRRLITLARNKAHLDENRALALSALGLLLDPELRPSLNRLRHHANYPARTSTLHEAFDIL